MSVRTHPLTLMGLLALALCLVWLMPADAVARSVFQSDPSSPLGPPTWTPTPTPTTTTTPSPSPTRFIPALPTAAPAAGATIGLPTPPPTLAPPTFVPLPTPSPTPTVTPGVVGYLPPPTLTASGAFAGGALPGSIIVGAAAPPSDQSAPPEPTPVESKSELAAMIDQVVLLVSYGWLCGGGFILVGTAAVLIWLARGGRPRT